MCVRWTTEAPETPPLRPEVLDSVLDKVRWRRRRSRWMTSAAVGVAAALLAVGVVVAIRPEIVGLENLSPPPTTQALDMTKVSQTPINASISMTGYGWGTRIDMACSYGDWGQSGNTPPQNLGNGRGGPRRQPHSGGDVARVVRCYCAAERHNPDAEGRNRCGATGFVG